MAAPARTGTRCRIRRAKTQLPHRVCKHGAESLCWSSMTYTYLVTNSVGGSTGISAPENPDLSRVTITSIFAADAHSYCMASSKSGICESIAQSTDPLVTGRTSNIFRSVFSLSYVPANGLTQDICGRTESQRRKKCRINVQTPFAKCPASHRTHRARNASRQRNPVPPCFRSE